MRSIIPLLVAALLTALSACSEDNEYPKKYTRFEFYPGEVKMHSRSGAITDAQTINKFTSNVRNYFLNTENPPEYVYSFDDDALQFENYDLQLTFFSETKGEIRIKSLVSGNFETIKFNLVERDGYYIVSMHDTIVTLSYGENPRLKCMPEIIKKESGPMGLEKVSFLRPLFIEKGKDEIKVCIVSYMENRHFSNEMVSIAISGPENNLIKPEYLQSLTTAAEELIDTIAYKESYIVFK